MNKKILFIIPSLAHGGTNKALENILNNINQKGLDIKIFSVDSSPKGTYYPIFKEYIIAEKANKLKYLITPIQSLKGKQFIYGIVLKVIRLIYKYLKKDFTVFLCKKTANNLSKYKFNTIVAFEEGIATLIGSFIKSPNKIAWVHCDYSTIPQYYTEAYLLYNHIICVSQYTRKTFIKTIPKCETKTIAIYNIQDVKNILQKSQLDSELKIPITSQTFNLISVGRVVPVKQFKKIPQIAYYLKQQKLNFKWYIIGEYQTTDEGKELLHNIEKYNVHDSVILLGPSSNPYVYMSKCQLYICLSKSEACPYVINEAKILHIPVISTDFPSITEFITHQYDGIICNIDTINTEIENIIKNKHLYNQIKENISSFTFNNTKIINQILELIKL